MVKSGGLPRKWPTLMAVPMSYAQIAEDIAERIDDGEYRPNDRLPSYAQLAELYSVSVSTASRAVAILRAQGLVVGSPGRGVFVGQKARD